jgi:hypothetical protein
MRCTLAAIFCFAVFAAPPAVHAQQNAKCLECHGDSIDAARQKASVHGVLGCTDCHTGKKDYLHESPQPVKCNTCHSGEAGELAESVHVKASAQPCLSCHGDAHTILPVKDPQSPVYPLNIPRTCGSCHGKAEMAKKMGMPEVYSMYMDSVHGFALSKDGLLVAANCSSCHGTHKVLSRKNPASRTYRTNVAATCGSCHQGMEAQYLAGVHGKAMKAGNAHAPVCIDCHTTHQISRPGLASWQVQTTATCGNCHKEHLATYRDTFHSQVSALGYVETARCWDCHGEHVILPASDPKSTVAAANLAATCGRCHTGVEARIASYQPHADARDPKKFPFVYYTRVFMDVLLLSVLGFFVLHTILWFIRAFFDRPKPEAPAASGSPGTQ